MSENVHISAGVVRENDDSGNGNWAIIGRTTALAAVGRGDSPSNSDGVPLGKDGGLTEDEILKILGWPV